MRKLIYLLSIVFLFSCTKEQLGPQCLNCDENGSELNDKNVLIVNEGAFLHGNGSLSIYEPEQLTLSQNVFSEENGFPLGDIVQSFTPINDKGFIVVNNSNKIEVVNTNDFTSITTITGFDSPRYLLPVSETKAYVTDLYSNSIQILNLSSNVIQSSINVNGWTEELVLINDTVYVCGTGSNHLLIIDPINDVLVDSVYVGVQPMNMVVDINSKLWVLCDGGINETNANLMRFDPQSRSVEANFIFPNISDSPLRLKLNSSKETIYFINKSVYSMSIYSSSLPYSAIINKSNGGFYGLGIDPSNDNIYVSDPFTFNQNGQVSRYNKLGELIHQFEVGVAPNGFVFIE